MSADMTAEDQMRIDAANEEAFAAASNSDERPPAQESDKSLEWPEAQSLAKVYERLDYPVDALPALMRNAVYEVGSYMQAPVALIAASALTSASIAVQGHVDVARDKKLMGPISTFILSIADSGERKSSLDGVFSQSIVNHEIISREAKAPEVNQYRADIETHNATCSGLKDQIKKLAAAGKSTEKHKTDLRELMQNEPRRPKLPSLLVTDITPEALAHKLGTEWPSAALTSDEGGAVFGGHGMGSDSVVRYLSCLNTLWDGKTLRVSRRTSDSFVVNNPRFTVHIQIQRDTFQEFLDKNARLARGSGFIARFLIAYPVSTQGQRMYREPPEASPAMGAFNNRLAEILAKDVPMNDRDELEPALMQLSPEAKAIWTEFYNQVESQLRVGGEFEDIRDTASKVADNAARLAALFSYFETQTPATDVSREHMESGVSVATWYLYESQRFLAEASTTDDERAATLLNDWLIEHCAAKGVDRVTRREIQQYGPNVTRDRETRNRALTDIAEANRVKFQQQGKSHLVILNPALMTEGSI